MWRTRRMIETPAAEQLLAIGKALVPLREGRGRSTVVDPWGVCEFYLRALYRFTRIREELRRSGRRCDLQIAASELCAKYQVSGSWFRQLLGLDADYQPGGRILTPSMMARECASAAFGVAPGVVANTFSREFGRRRSRKSAPVP